jgi:hypothetical protein
MGRFHGDICKWGGSCPWGKLSLGRFVDSTNCPWGEIENIIIMSACYSPLPLPAPSWTQPCGLSHADTKVRIQTTRIQVLTALSPSGLQIK